MPEMSDEERRAWLDYQRWAIPPLASLERFLEDHRLAVSDFPAWRKWHGI